MTPIIAGIALESAKAGETIRIMFGKQIPEGKLYLKLDAEFQKLKKRFGEELVLKYCGRLVLKEFA